jgi:hypothetical protein
MEGSYLAGQSPQRAVVPVEEEEEEEEEGGGGGGGGSFKINHISLLCVFSYMKCVSCEYNYNCVTD